MAPWNLVLRFLLEIEALVGLAMGGWAIGAGPLRWLLAVALPVAATLAWGAFNVRDDPSRSGTAPLAVPGWVRLAIELMVLGGGGVGLFLADRAVLGTTLLVAVAVHYVVAWRRVPWLLRQ